VAEFTDNDFTMVEIDDQNKLLNFSHFEQRTDSKMQGLSASIMSFDWNKFELMEAKQLSDGTIRMLGVRTGTEVFIWEQTSGSNATPRFEDLIVTRLSALQTPYFAYSNGGNTINICPLFEPGLQLVHKLDLEEGEEIQKLLFSENNVLYIITSKGDPEGTKTHFTAHAIEVH
jgi:hypothetical protein